MRKIFALTLATFFYLTASAENNTDTIKVGQSLKRFALLNPSTRQYIRYIVKDGKRTLSDIWTRTVRFEEKNGQKCVRIYQKWESPDTTKNKIIDSWFEYGTLKPLTHERYGYLSKEGFKFLPDKIIGIEDLADNIRKDFSINTPIATFNFETDMETFQTLPLKEGYTAVINFYHCGAGEPHWYTFVVDGSEKVKLANGKELDCWVISTDYNHPEKGKTKFWVEKGSQLFVKQQSPLPTGGYLYKNLLLMPE